MKQRMKAESKKITPSMAKKWLENIWPRSATRFVRTEKGTVVSKRQVAQYVEDITEGRWIENGCAIILGPDGELVDGVQRLTAVVEANKPIKSLVVRLNSLDDPKIVLDRGGRSV
jgi:hypothetical protein